MHITVELSGEREFERSWQAFKVAASDGCRRAVRCGVTEAAADARTSHRFKNQTGDLERSIGGEVLTETQGGAEGIVYAKEKYASFVETDTVAHVIRPKRAGGLLAWQHPQGNWHFAREVHHPGTQGQPFMGPAFQKCEAVAMREIEASVVEAQKALGR